MHCRLRSWHPHSASHNSENRGLHSPYVVYLQGGALVTHGDRAEHHFPQHVDIRSWSCVLPFMRETKTKIIMWHNIMYNTKKIIFINLWVPL